MSLGFFYNLRRVLLTGLCPKRRIGRLRSRNVGNLRRGRSGGACRGTGLFLLRTRRVNFYLGGATARSLATSEDRGECARSCGSTTTISRRLLRRTLLPHPARKALANT